MSDRRPHWTDELINAVIDLQYHCVDCMEDDYPDIDPRNHDAVNAAWACEVIAAVEDWARWEHVPKGTLRRLEQAEAAIARVRELHKVGTNSCPNCGPFCDGCGQEYPCATTCALDGE